MRKLIPMTTTALALALALATGCKDKTQEPSMTQTTGAQPATATTATSATTPTTTSATPLSKDDRDFLTNAAEDALLEVALGQQASAKGATPDVKAFGDRMVADHTKADAELQQLGASKGVTLPTELDKSHQSKLDQLSKLSGKKLDKAYADDMVDDQEADVKDFKKASQDLKDPDLRAWAAKTLPVVEQHLAMAKDMKVKAKH